MTIKIDTSNFSSNFGRNPRPRDYALWMFFMGRNGAYTQFTFNGTYATAAKLAKAEAKSLGCQSISIAP